MGEVERWSPQDFKGKVENRIREQFVELIPEEAFKQMVSDAIDNFTTGRVLTNKSGYGENVQETQSYVPSGLERLVEEMLKSEVRDQLRRMLATDEWRVNHQGVVGEKLAEIVHKATPAIIQRWVTQLVENLIEQARSTY
jgi:hypothetical protein